MKKILSVFLVSILLLSAFSMIGVSAQTNNATPDDFTSDVSENVSESTSATSNTSESVSESTESNSTEPFESTNPDTTEPLESTAPQTTSPETIEPSETTDNNDNVTFEIDDGIDGTYTRQTVGNSDVVVIYIKPVVYSIGEVKITVNDTEVSAAKGKIGKEIYTYTITVNPNDKVNIKITKGALADRYRFEFIVDDYLHSKGAEGGYSVQIDRENNIAKCSVDFAVDHRHGVDAHFYVDGVELTDIVFKHISVDYFDLAYYSYEFNVGLQDKVVVKATSYILPTESDTTEPDSTQPITTQPSTASEPSTSTEPPTSNPVTEPSTSNTEPTEPATSASKAKISPDKVSLKAGGTKTLKVTNGTVKSWKSLNKKVAAVKNGKVTALTKGTATITATLTTGKKLTSKITVTSNPKLTKNGKTVTTVKVAKGSTVKIKITGKAKRVDNIYKNTKYAKITSKKSADTIKIKGKKKGTSTLKITVNGKQLKLKVKVK